MHVQSWRLRKARKRRKKGYSSTVLCRGPSYSVYPAGNKSGIAEQTLGITNRSSQLGTLRLAWWEVEEIKGKRKTLGGKERDRRREREREKEYLPRVGGHHLNQPTFLPEFPMQITTRATRRHLHPFSQRITNNQKKWEGNGEGGREEGRGWARAIERRSLEEVRPRKKDRHAGSGEKL